ncbi:unnamed protein product [Darwinula stevensoni]|uniref:Uncharacterized protein n=1 Tax=Darwinula stevensoni TaxID=69355 RepID=A0A7R8X832_9CRUS|nr:unnamed protein product [Darwinula stevensoni]CAG0882950.1 unnamed protein product [Darwinula stevensoni]
MREGNLGDISSAGGLHDYLVELHEEFGDIVSFWWGKELVISLGSPDLLKETAHMFNRPPQLFAFLEDLVGKKSIQYANGKDGRMRREQYDKCFSHAACISYFPIIKKVSDDLVEQLQNVPVGDHVPVHKYMTAFAIKNVLKCCFGGISDEDIVHIALEYDVAMNEMQRKLSGQLLPDEDPREHRYRKSLKVLHGSVKRIVDHWRKERGGARNGEDSSHLFLDTIIDFVEGKAELSEQEKLDIIYSDTMSYLVGGFHTTGNYTLYDFGTPKYHVEEEAAYVIGDH